MVDQAFEQAVVPHCERHRIFWEACPDCWCAKNIAAFRAANTDAKAAANAFEAADEKFLFGETEWPKRAAAQRFLNRIYSGVAAMADTPADVVNHPPHYTSHPSGVECITITRHMGFNLGNVLKYIWRADLKHQDGGIEDLEKAVWYLQDEIKKRRGD